MKQPGYRSWVRWRYPQVEADKVEAVASLRATEPDALVHVGFGHGLFGFNDALAKANWSPPPRYTMTAFELAHIDPMWMDQLAGWIGLDSYDERNAVGQEFLDRFEARFGRRPNYFMPPLCRDVATVIVHAIANARPLTGAGVKEALEGVKFVPAASGGAPGGTCMQFGRYIRQGWMGGGLPRRPPNPTRRQRACFFPCRAQHGPYLDLGPADRKAPAERCRENG